MSGDRRKPPPLPMPRLISVAEEERLRAAGEWPPPPRPPSEPGVRIVPPGDGEKKPLPPAALKRILARRGEYMRDPPPWEVERTARKKAEAEAAAKKDKDEGG